MDSQHLSYAIFQVDNSKIYLGSRVDLNEMTLLKKELASIDAWMSLSDHLVPHPKGKISQWLPWPEHSGVTPENVFAGVLILNYWISELKLRNIYIHCDGGVTRSPALFGLYLLAFHKNKANEIVSHHQLKNRLFFSDPLDYAAIFLDDFKREMHQISPIKGKQIAKIVSDVKEAYRKDPMLSFDWFLKV